MTAVVLFSMVGIGRAEEGSQHYPAWSWDRIPVMLHFGSHRQMTDEQIQLAAGLSNFICLEKAHGWHTDRKNPERIIAADAKRLKTANPNAKVLFYWNTLIAWPFTSYNKNFAETHPQDWTLRDLKTGEPLLKSTLGETPVFQYNLLNAKTREWWVKTVAGTLREFDFDGVYMDAISQAQRRSLLVDGWGVDKSEALTLATIDMMKKLRTEMGSKRLLIYNGLRSQDGDIDDNAQGGVRYAPYGDGSMIEHFDQFNSADKEDIVKYWSMAKSCAEQGKIVIYKAWPGHDANFQNEEFLSQGQTKLESVARQNIVFPLACFLIGIQKHAYFCYGWGYNIDDGQLIPYAEYRRRLGAPKGSASREGNSWIFTREFEHCSVRVDLEQRTARISWDSGDVQTAGQESTTKHSELGSKPVDDTRQLNSDWNKISEQIVAMEQLTKAPMTYQAEGFASEDKNIRAIYYEGLPWKGKSTRVFAWLGVPQQSSLKNSEGKIPGIVLVHGGGGTAFQDWVKKWNGHGFAAVSIAVEGQTDEELPKGSANREGGWKSHTWAGPARNGIYGDSDQPLPDQWMYHAVADTILANSLLRSLPEVDQNKVGLMGVSWGGVITSTVIGIDSRFAFAIPTYGCGHLADVPNQYGRALNDNELYRHVWDPIHRLGRAKMPVLWFSWPGDLHFPLDCQAESYRATAGPRMISLVPGMRHGHGPAWTRNESYAFAESVVTSGKPWCSQSSASASDGKANVTWTIVGKQQIDQARLVTTTEDGATGSRKWVETPATLQRNGPVWTATAKLPSVATAWFMNAQCGDLIVSSEYQETKVKSSGVSGASPVEPSSPQKAKLFARLDVDSNGTISAKEYIAHYGSVFDQLDKDRSGKLDNREFANAAAIRAGDGDSDGKLTKNEYRSFFEKQFSNLDSDKNGVLTKEEWK